MSTATINVESFLNDITEIFGLDPDDDSDHERALKEVRQAIKKNSTN